MAIRFTWWETLVSATVLANWRENSHVRFRSSRDAHVFAQEQESAAVETITCHIYRRLANKKTEYPSNFIAGTPGIGWRYSRTTAIVFKRNETGKILLVGAGCELTLAQFYHLSLGGIMYDYIVAFISLFIHQKRRKKMQNVIISISLNILLL